MSILLERVPTLSHRIRTEPAGPRSSRPFGLDSLSGSTVIDGRRPFLAIDPQTQLSLLDGQIVIENSAMDAGSSCNTESDGRDAIAIDTDQNDD